MDPNRNRNHGRGRGRGRGRKPRRKLSFDNPPSSPDQNTDSGLPPPVVVSEMSLSDPLGVNLSVGQWNAIEQDAVTRDNNKSSSPGLDHFQVVPSSSPPTDSKPSDDGWMQESGTFVIHENNEVVFDSWPDPVDAMFEMKIAELDEEPRTPPPRPRKRTYSESDKGKRGAKPELPSRAPESKSLLRPLPKLFPLQSVVTPLKPVVAPLKPAVASESRVSPGRRNQPQAPTFSGYDDFISKWSQPKPLTPICGKESRCNDPLKQLDVPVSCQDMFRPLEGQYQKIHVPVDPFAELKVERAKREEQHKSAMPPPDAPKLIGNENLGDLWKNLTPFRGFKMTDEQDKETENDGGNKWEEIQERQQRHRLFSTVPFPRKPCKMSLGEIKRKYPTSFQVYGLEWIMSVLEMEDTYLEDTEEEDGESILRKDNYPSTDFVGHEAFKLAPEQGKERLEARKELSSEPNVETFSVNVDSSFLDEMSKLAQTEEGRVQIFQMWNQC